MDLNLKEIRHISLKWKLLIPFFFLPVAVTVLLVGWGVHVQHRILSNDEENQIRGNFRIFSQRLELRLELAGLLAEMVARDPETQKALAERDREALIRIYQPMYEKLKQLPGIHQFHFHTYPPRSFLRLHKKEMFGDDLSGYRQTINQAHAKKDVVSGFEYGLTGFSLRGVAPIYYEGRPVGSVEIGTNLGLPYLQRIGRALNSHVALYIPDEKKSGEFKLLASTSNNRNFLGSPLYDEVFETGNTEYRIAGDDNESRAVLVGLLRGFMGQRVGVVEISRDRQTVMSLIRKYRIMIVAIGLTVLALSLLFVWWVSEKFLDPIHELVVQAEKITRGEQVPQVAVKARDEFGTLAVALNKMLSFLEESRMQLEQYAHGLEDKVQERTAALVQSEEKFRTLVENIPLVVYRLEKTMIRSFVSSHIEKLTGWPPEELVGGPAIWSNSIHPEDRERVVGRKRRALTEKRVFEMEYRLIDKQGQTVEVLDHAEPVGNDEGRGIYMEGYMLDIRARKRLEEQILQAEELRSLTDISARLAHEFRNPLSIVGLTARRLAKKMNDDDPNSKYPEILIDQVGRLESIINMIQTYIQPMKLTLVETDARKFIDEVVREASGFCSQCQVELELDVKPDLGKLKLDRKHMDRALLNLIRNAMYQIPMRGVLQLSAYPDGKTMEIKMVYPAGYLPDDQLRHFFYPFTTEDADTSLVDLPLVPVIVHKHGGVIHVGRWGDDLVAVTITLPTI